MRRSNFFSKVRADFCPPCTGDTHLYILDQQTSVFVKALMLDDDQLIKWSLISTTLLLQTSSNPVVEVRVVSSHASAF